MRISERLAVRLGKPVIGREGLRRLTRSEAAYIDASQALYIMQEPNSEISFWQRTSLMNFRSCHHATRAELQKKLEDFWDGKKKC